MLRKAGGGGAAGGAGGSAGGGVCSIGGGGGGAGAVAAALSVGAGSRTIGADFSFGAAGVFFGVTGAGAGGGATAATAGCDGGCTDRLLTTVLMPATWEASAAARERTASLLTVPLRVATPFWTEDWMDSVLMAPSPAMRLWTALVREASSAGGELLQPARPRLRAKVSEAARERARGAERFRRAYMRPHFCVRWIGVANTLTHQVCY